MCGEKKSPLFSCLWRFCSFTSTCLIASRLPFGFLSIRHVWLVKDECGRWDLKSLWRFAFLVVAQLVFGALRWTVSRWPLFDPYLPIPLWVTCCKLCCSVVFFFFNFSLDCESRVLGFLGMNPLQRAASSHSRQQRGACSSLTIHRPPSSYASSSSSCSVWLFVFSARVRLRLPIANRLYRLKHCICWWDLTWLCNY